jgi:pathogenesis-related protein 1
MFRYCLFTLALAGSAAAQLSPFAGSATGGVSSSSLAREMVAAHNAVRARLGIAPLRWSDTLASFAQQWANQLIHSGQFAHSQNPKYGENLYEISGGTATPATVVNTWAEEVRNYDYGTNSCRGVCGHYTQVVWRDTSEVGCAVARAGAREVWVCEYNPPGNWVGRKPY